MRRLFASLLHGLGFELGSGPGRGQRPPAISSTSSERSHRSMRSRPGWLPAPRTDARHDRAHGGGAAGAMGRPAVAVRVATA